MNGVEHYLSIFTKAVFIENIVLAYFLGLCSFLAISKKIDASVGIGLAVIVVLTITAPINWFLWEFLLDKGALVWISEDFKNTDLGFLKLIVFISVIAAMVQFTIKIQIANSALEVHLSDLQKYQDWQDYLAKSKMRSKKSRKATLPSSAN